MPFDEVSKRGLMKLGEAVLTNSGELACKGIIHVAGINIFWRSSEKAIRRSIRNMLVIMGENGFVSVAIPLIGCGANKFPEERCIEIIKEELEKSTLEIEAIIVYYK